MKAWCSALSMLVIVGMIAGMGLVGGCDNSDGDGDASGATASFLVGPWSGTWNDTRFGVSGPIEFTITQNGDAFTVTGTVGLDPFGMVAQTLTGSGAIAGNTVTFSLDTESIGGITGTITGTTMSGSGESTGVLSFGPVTYSGTAAGSQISVNFEFTRPGAGAGTVTLIKQ